jgi:hypothetical protein
MQSCHTPKNCLQNSVHVCIRVSLCLDPAPTSRHTSKTRAVSGAEWPSYMRDSHWVLSSPLRWALIAATCSSIVIRPIGSAGSVTTCEMILVANSINVIFASLLASKDCQRASYLQEFAKVLALVYRYVEQPIRMSLDVWVGTVKKNGNPLFGSLLLLPNLDRDSSDSTR